ncbi:MAG TPA: hypothetical protein VIH88_02475 [Candidatus Acidoferrales bacterium]
MKLQRLLCVIAVVIGFSTILLAFHERTASAIGQETTSTNDLKAIYDDDQNDRTNINAASIQHDADRREQIHRLLNAGRVQSGEDYYFAAMVYQHGQTPHDYLLAHVLAMTSVAKGYKDGIWLAAATLDRYLQSVKEPQIFGTQYFQWGKNPYSQEPYDKDLVSDSLRAAWCVAPYSTQIENLKAINAGKDFQSTRVCQ